MHVKQRCMQQCRSLSQQSEVQHELCVVVHDTQHSATACHSRAEVQRKLRMAVHDLQHLILTVHDLQHLILTVHDLQRLILKALHFRSSHGQCVLPRARPRLLGQQQCVCSRGNVQLRVRGVWDQAVRSFPHWPPQPLLWQLHRELVAATVRLLIIHYE